MIRPGILIRGKITPTIDLKGKTNASIIREYPELENVEIKPTTEEQILKSEKYGFDEVKILGVTAEIDKNIKSENIKAGVSILDVEGGYEGIDTSDATATPNDILIGKTAYADNKKIEGAMQKYDGAYSGEVGNRPENAIINTSYQPTTYVSGGDNSTLNQLLTKVPNIDTSNFTQLNYMYYRCNNLIEIPEVNAQKAQYFASVYENCKNVKKLSIKNTSNIISFSRAFRDCLLLEEISVLDGTKANNIENTFYRCDSLKKFDGIINLGKAYTQKTENYYKYVFNLSQSVLLTHESLINIINNLYDLNLTYDVANGGTLYRQQLVLGSTNLAKLTEEEIAIATNKGWNVS